MKFLCILFLVLAWVTPNVAHAASITLIGDSHMVPLSHMLVPLLEADGHTVRVIANPGWSVDAYNRSRVVEQSIGSPDFVFVCLGGNDFPVPQDVYQRRLSHFLGKIYASGARKVIWFGPPKAEDEEVDARHARITRLQLDSFIQIRVRWIDSRLFTSNLDYQLDRVHFSASSYDVWAVDMYNCMQAYLSE